ncbi:hypothetical protein [Pedobacter sp. FW305-3-2-15-E-R2A2]|uniref:hypothetical protein n=1 Tax=Pedobacter sp. FW305-3-2-15-E-R2A2 TaxID=3140251 RepID=UPI0031402736
MVDQLADHPNQIDKSPYAYGWNNPVNLTDPDGNCPVCPIIAYHALRYVAAAVLAGGITYTVTNGIKQYTKGRNYEDSSSDATSLAKPILVGIKTEKAPESVAEEPEPAVEKS